MDANDFPRGVRQGGSIEPVQLPAAGPSGPRLQPVAGERYELRDLLDEATYRFDRLEQMIGKAEELGATRFFAVSADGRLTPISKVSGEWTRADAPAPQAGRGSLTAPRHISEVLPQIATPEDIAAGPASERERKARIARIEAALNERYIIKRAPIRLGDVAIGHTEYRHRGDTTRVAFTESAFRLATDTNSPSVARSMVDVAEARGWQSFRVSGHEDFKRLIWIEASLRSLRTVGYQPVPGDQELLRKEVAARTPAPAEPGPLPADRASAAQAGSARGSGGRRTVLVALEAVLIAQRVPARQREAVMAAAEENLARRLDRGETHRVRVYDKTAAPQRAPALSTRVVSRDRDRPSPER